MSRVIVSNGPPRKPAPDRLLRGVALVLLSIFQLQLKLLSGVVRLGIAAIRREARSSGAGVRRRPE